MKLGAALMSASLFLFACDDGATTRGSLVPEIARLDVVSGQDQQGPAGAELAEPLVVRVLDAGGQPISGQIVNFRVVDGGGSVFAGAALTNTDGLAQERWTLGPTPGSAQTVEARAVDSASGEKRVFATFSAEAYTPIGSVEITPTSLDLEIDETGTLTATAYDESGGEVTAVEPEWESSDTTVATVSGDGQITGLKEGTVQITATMGGESGSASVTVSEPDPSGPPATPSTPQITTADNGSDSFLVLAEWPPARNAATYDWATGGNNTGWTLTGTVTDTSVAFTAPRNGAASYWFCITAVNSDGVESANPACNSYTAPPTSGQTVGSVTVSPDSAQVAPGDTVHFRATVRDTNGNPMSVSVTWSSNNTNVATVSSSGVVTGQSEGPAVITASAGGQSDSGRVTVDSSSPPPPPPSGGVLFSSNWSAGTGTSDFATSDGGTWPYLICPASARRPVLEVVSGATYGWSRSTNILQVTNHGQSYCGQLETRTDIPQGEDYYVRMYIRVENENQIGFHSIAINCCGDIQAGAWAIFNPVEGVDYTPVMHLETPSTSRWTPPDKIPMQRWYRFEWYVDFVSPGSTSARIWPRIYDEDGTLLYDASDYISDTISGSLQEFYDGGGVHTFTSLDLARRWAVGYEGTGGTQDLGGRNFYFANVEIRSDTWPGP